jgi:8-amino-7-oxononanoate synthase
VTDADGGRWAAWVADQCSIVHGAGQWRTLRPFDSDGVRGRIGDQPAVVSYASNDYLGLTQHPAVKAAARDAIDRWGTGSGAARLVVGSRPIHHQLEADLAAWKGTERAVLFPTGFAANLGLLTALATASATIFSDELNHASIIDGARLARADVQVFRHRDVEHLVALLGAHRDRRALVVTDLVFSMDGDEAPVDELLAVCRDNDALLVLDEAHSVLGPELDAERLGDTAVLRMGTLSKTLGSLGGFVAGPAAVCDLIVNRARPFIFTTASTPADAAAARAALSVVRSDEGTALQARLRGHVERLAPGWPSPILPVLIGDEDEAMRAAAALLDAGALVPAIRPPTVPPGTSRLRIALSAAHTDAELAHLAGALDAAGLTVGPAVGPASS